MGKILPEGIRSLMRTFTRVAVLIFIGGDRLPPTNAPTVRTMWPVVIPTSKARSRSTVKRYSGYLAPG